MQLTPVNVQQPPTPLDHTANGTSPAASTNAQSIAATKKMSPEQRQYLKATAMSSADLGAILTKPTERIAKHVTSAIAHEASAKKQRAEARAGETLIKRALLETDWTKMEERVQTAESEIHKRRLLLSQDHGGTPEEREALVNAMSGLRILWMDVASWLERQGFDAVDKRQGQR